MTETEGREEPAETLEFTHRELNYLIDAVMVLMHQMEQVRLRQADPSQLPELQRLLERLMS